MMILAKRAVEVTAVKTRAQYLPAWKKVIERFFFHGIAGDAGKPCVRWQTRLSFSDRARSAAAAGALSQKTCMRTQSARKTVRCGLEVPRFHIHTRLEWGAAREAD